MPIQDGVNLVSPTEETQNMAAFTLGNTPDETVLEIFRLHGGAVNIDQVKETAQIEYAQALEILWRLRRRGEIVQAFYETRFALSGS